MDNLRKKYIKGQCRWASTDVTRVSEKETNENGEEEIIKEIIAENLLELKRDKSSSLKDPKFLTKNDP